MYLKPVWVGSGVCDPASSDDLTPQAAKHMLIWPPKGRQPCSLKKTRGLNMDRVVQNLTALYQNLVRFGTRRVSRALRKHTLLCAF